MVNFCTEDVEFTFLLEQLESNLTKIERMLQKFQQQGKTEVYAQFREKFSEKLADAKIQDKIIVVAK